MIDLWPTEWTKTGVYGIVVVTDLYGGETTLSIAPTIYSCDKTVT